MRMKSLTGIVTALAVASSPVMVAPAFAAQTNAASSLSVAKSVRASTPSKANNKLGGGAGFLGILIAAGVIAIGVVAIVKDDNSASN